MGCPLSPVPPGPVCPGLPSWSLISMPAVDRISAVLSLLFLRNNGPDLKVVGLVPRREVLVSAPIAGRPHNAATVSSRAGQAS